MYSLPRYRYKQARNQHGISMAAILATGLIMSLFAAGMLGTMTPILEKTASLKYAGSARTYAELGMDYAISQINSGATGVNCSSTANASVTWNVPQSVLVDPKANVTVNVSTLPTSTGNPPKNSILYDPLLNAYYPYAYRMLTVTCQYGGTTKQIRSLLEPIIPASNGSSTPGSVGFPFGLFGVSSVVYAGKAAFNSYNTSGGDPRLGADAGTMGKISQVYGGGGLSRSIAEGGSHYEFPDPQSYYAKEFGITGSMYNARPAGSAPWMSMTGNVYSNGNNTAYYPVDGSADAQTSAFNNGSSSTPAHNVFGIENGLQAGIPDGSAFPSSGPSSSGQGQGFISETSDGHWSGGASAWNVSPGSNGVTYPQPTLPAVPTAPAGTVNLGSISLNNSSLVFDSSVPSGQAIVNGQMQPISTIGTVKNGNVSLPPGNYSINNMSLSNNSSVECTPETQTAINSGAQPPVNLYVQGTNNGSTVLSVDNTSSINMSGISGESVNTSGNMGLTNANGQSPLASDQIAINPPGTSGNISETSGGASELQMYYSGSSYNSNTSTFNSQIVLSGNERMTIYAPNTGILVGSPSVSASRGPSALQADANFYGALVGGSIGINSAYGTGGGAYVHYDFKLRPPGMQFINPWGQAPPFLSQNSSKPLPPSGYRAVTWQEAVTPNAANPSGSQWTVN